MKRLFSILLMNAWNSLSRKASLPTVGMVGVSVMALLVASTVTAGASPDTALSGAVKVAAAVPKALVQLSLPILGDGGTPHHSTKPASPKPAKDSEPPSGGNNATTAPGNSNSNSTSSNGQGGSQSVAAALTVSPTTTCQQGATTYTVNTAELDLQTPATAAGAVTWYWETRQDNATSGQQITDSATASQAFNAGATKITLSNTSSSDTGPQPLYTITSDPTTARTFRLHVTGPVDVTSNWFSVPVSAASCPTTTTTTNNS